MIQYNTHSSISLFQWQSSLIRVAQLVWLLTTWPALMPFHYFLGLGSLSNFHQWICLAIDCARNIVITHERVEVWCHEVSPCVHFVWYPMALGLQSHGSIWSWVLSTYQWALLALLQSPPSPSLWFHRVWWPCRCLQKGQCNQITISLPIWMHHRPFSQCTISIWPNLPKQAPESKEYDTLIQCTTFNHIQVCIPPIVTFLVQSQCSLLFATFIKHRSQKSMTLWYNALHSTTFKFAFHQLSHSSYNHNVVSCLQHSSIKFLNIEDYYWTTYQLHNSIYLKKSTFI